LPVAGCLPQLAVVHVRSDDYSEVRILQVDESVLARTFLIPPLVVLRLVTRLDGGCRIKYWNIPA